MKILVLAVGGLKEAYWRQMQDACVRNLSKQCQFGLIEVRDEPIPPKFSAKEGERIKQKEGERLLAKVAPTDYLVALDVEGELLSTPELIDRLAAWSGHASRQATFVIGGALGLSSEVTRRANAAWSFSRMTFPHRLARIILLEAIERATGGSR